MKKHSEGAALLGIQYPIVQGPFGGGMSTIELASAVSNAGGLGSYGAHNLEPAEIEQLCRNMRKQTKQPFAINLWVSDYDESFENLTRSEFELRASKLGETYNQLGAKSPVWPEMTNAVYEQQVEAVLRSKPNVFSFVFGIPSRDILNECRKRNIVTIGAATTIDEALAVEAAGVDSVLVSGFEAGGHRPSFLKRSEDSLVGTMALVPTVRDQVKIPIIAAGGIADGRGMRAAFELGADAVQIGTAFLACYESGIDPTHREQLEQNNKGNTRLTRAFSGRLARFMTNEFIEDFEKRSKKPLPFPAQSWLTAPIKTAATEKSDISKMALYAGQGVPLTRRQKASELMECLIAELET